jgi:uncharacterized protein YecE (DUF72 family)
MEGGSSTKVFQVCRISSVLAAARIFTLVALSIWRGYHLHVTEPARIHLGTSAFTAPGWRGSFYPPGMKSSEYLTFYAEHFDTVEVDSTFYACPSMETVKGWALKTPSEFIFSVKVPRTITHEKVLVDCDREFEQFVGTMNVLDEKLGPMVFQFPFFNTELFNSPVQFLSRLKPFFKKLPRIVGYQFAVEIRNKWWLTPRFADLLREYNVALVLQHPNELNEKFDPITADFTYIRWLGDRKGIEEMTKSFDKTVVDRTDQLSGWVDFCQRIQKRGVTQYIYANNHYGGHAPATITQFRDLWHAKGSPELDRPKKLRQETGLLFGDANSELV